MVADHLDTLKVVELSSDDKLMEDADKDPEDDQEEDSEEDPELGERQTGHDIEHVELGTSDSNFGLYEKPRDEFEPEYDPYRDR